MKKILVIILALATILSFSACYDDGGRNAQIENDNVDDSVDDETPKQNTSVIRASGTDQGVNWVFYEDGELVISGWSEMGNGNVNASSYDWHDFCDYITKVTITEGVMNISDSAFEGCINLESVYMADTVTEIGDSAFSGCEKLSIIKLSNNLTFMGRSAFQGCNSIRDIKFPVGIEDICGFDYCSGLTSVTIPSGVTDIGVSAFYNCINLSEIYIPETVENIYKNAFDNCTNLTDIYYEGDETAWLAVRGYYTGIQSNGFECIGDFLPDTITVHYNSTMP
ncbi:MAG: leucine-rich repeat domain-containing protein [Clostridia bacterium]|nr:leucine-rich repeat domain-containing protein [Clostridia bacterium]